MSQLRSLIRIDADKLLANRPESWPQKAPIIGSLLAFEQEDTKALDTAEGKVRIDYTDEGLRIHYTSEMFFSGFMIGGYSKPSDDFDTLIVEDGPQRPLLHIENSGGLTVVHGLAVHEQDLIIGHIATSVFEKLTNISAAAKFGINNPPAL
jgi:hypothetical protein